MGCANHARTIDRSIIQAVLWQNIGALQLFSIALLVGLSSCCLTGTTAAPFAGASQELPLVIKDLFLDVQYKVLSEHATTELDKWQMIGQVVIRRDDRLPVHEGISLHSVEAEDSMLSRTWQDRKEAIVEELKKSAGSSSSKVLGFRMIPSLRNSLPRRDSRWVLQTSIPFKQLQFATNVAGLMVVHLTANGVPIALSYRRQAEERAVLITGDTIVWTLPSSAVSAMPLPNSPPATGPDQTSKQSSGGGTLLQRYWWVLLVVLLWMTAMGGEGATEGQSGDVTSDQQQSSGSGSSSGTPSRNNPSTNSHSSHSMNK